MENPSQGENKTEEREREREREVWYVFPHVLSVNIPSSPRFPNCIEGGIISVIFCTYRARCYTNPAMVPTHNIRSYRRDPFYKVMKYINLNRVRESVENYRIKWDPYVQGHISASKCPSSWEEEKNFFTSSTPISEFASAKE